MTNVGKVYLVGAGPGDIGLVTKKALECIQKADVILYDRLANPRLLHYAKEDCAFIYCGKLPTNHVMRQEMINENLVTYAKAGKTVVRLKGGDPTVFGRVGEEAEELQQHGISYEMVPGVTSSIGAATYAGIPVTHREFSESFTVMTGHRKEEVDPEKINYDAIQGKETLAFYMGIKNLQSICTNLIKKGKNSTTPVAVIEWGTTGKQKTVTGTLETIVSQLENAGITNPAMTIVGNVVSLREKLQWFEKKEHYGKRIIMAKASDEESKIGQYFNENGAEVLSFPTFKKETVKLSPSNVESAMKSERIVFYSPESVDIFWNELVELGYDVRDLPRKLACISQKTMDALSKKGIRGELASHQTVKTTYIGRRLKEQEEVMETYGEGVYYTTHALHVDTRFDEMNNRLLTESNWETVIFPSRSSVDYYMDEMKRLGFEEKKAIIPCACIGKSVLEYAKKHGFTTVDEQMQDLLDTRKWKVK